MLDLIKFIKWHCNLVSGNVGVLICPMKNPITCLIKHGKKKVKKENWYLGDTLNAAIGQGFVQVSPFDMLMMMHLVALKGQGVSPRYEVNSSIKIRL